MTLSARMDSYSFAHLNGTFTHKALCLCLMTDENRNSNHLHTCELSQLLSYQNSQLNASLSGTQDATHEFMVKAFQLSSEMLQNNQFFTAASKNLTNQALYSSNITFILVSLWDLWLDISLEMQRTASSSVKTQLLLYFGWHQHHWSAWLFTVSLASADVAWTGFVVSDNTSIFYHGLPNIFLSA